MVEYTSPVGTKSPRDLQRSLDTEFRYYSCALRNITRALSHRETRKLCIAWLRKLMGPEYHTSHFKDKRNRYLANLTISFINNEAVGVFKQLPPLGSLLEVGDIQLDTLEPPAWEVDTTWDNMLQGLPDINARMKCTVHEEGGCLAPLDNSGNALDEMFKYFLHHIRPYAALLSDLFDDKRLCAAWMQALCMILPESCLEMKIIRNDYAVALLGYVSDLRLDGPFREFPPSGRLPPLEEMADFCKSKNPFTDYTSRDAKEFMAAQSLPDNGAFCYVAVSGDLIGSNLLPNPPPPVGQAEVMSQSI